MDLGILLIVLQLIYPEGTLSIDNAAVLGAMVSALPKDDPIPWPPALRFLQHPGPRLLGGQRLAALKVGLLGAYVGRGSMLFIASWVVQNRWLLLLGGLYLIKLAADHLGAIGPYLPWLKRVLGVVSLLFLWTLKPIGWFFGGFVGVTRVLAVLFATRIRPRPDKASGRGGGSVCLRRRVRNRPQAPLTSASTGRRRTVSHDTSVSADADGGESWLQR